MSNVLPHAGSTKLFLLLSALGMACFALSALIGTTIDENGFLHEPGFFLLPVGWALLLAGIAALGFGALRTAMRKIRA